MTTTDVTATAHLEQRLKELAPDLLAYFVRRVEPRDDAADCLSETLLVIWRRRASIPTDPDALRPWAFGVAQRVLSNQRRGRVRQGRLAEALRSEVRASPPPPVDGRLHEALATLSARDRELVMLVAWEGFGVAEAGALVGLRPGAARTRYSRARARLREALEP